MIAEIWGARERLQGVALRTPLVPLRGGPAGTDVWLKLENLQHGGSYKLRGLYNRVAALGDEVRRRGAKTMSAGNAAIALAYAGQALGAPVDVVMSETASPLKVATVQALGGTVIRLAPPAFLDYVVNERWREEKERLFVHPFDHPQVWAGHGTCGLEILEELPSVRTVLVPIGGGGLVAGVANAVKALAPGARVIGVQAAATAPWPEALRRGDMYRVPDPQPTIADGIALPAMFAGPWQAARDRLDGCITVTEDDIRTAIRLLATRNSIVAEGAGAAATAAALKLTPADGPVAAVVSGGNIDPSLLASVLTA